MDNRPYRSTGTIRVQFEPDENDNSGLRATKIFFTPNADSTVRNRGTQYAVFIGGHNFRGCIRREIPDSGEGVSITVQSDHPGLLAAATQQTLVEIEVNCSWVLRAITIPAASKKT